MTVTKASAYCRCPKSLVIRLTSFHRVVQLAQSVRRGLGWGAGWWAGGDLRRTSSSSPRSSARVLWLHDHIRRQSIGVRGRSARTGMLCDATLCDHESVVQRKARYESCAARRQSEASERAEAERCLSPVSKAWARLAGPCMLAIAECSSFRARDLLSGRCSLPC